MNVFFKKKKMRRQIKKNAFYVTFEKKTHSPFEKKFKKHRLLGNDFKISPFLGIYFSGYSN